MMKSFVEGRNIQSKVLSATTFKKSLSPLRHWVTRADKFWQKIVRTKNQTKTTKKGFKLEGHVSPFFFFWVCGDMFA